MSRYRSIRCLIWNDDKFPFASDACQLVFFHMLTTPLSSPFGLYKASLEALAAEKRWTPKAYREAFEEASRIGFAKYDDRTQVVFIPNFLKYNAPNNPNVLRSWHNLFTEIPDCPLKTEFLQLLRTLCDSFGKGFQEAFEEAWRKSMPNQDQDQDQDQEQDQEHWCGGIRLTPQPRQPSLLDDTKPPPGASQTLKSLYLAMQDVTFLVPGKGQQTIWENAKNPRELAQRLDQACPGVDLPDLIKKLAGWTVVNPNRAKRDLAKFIWNNATRDQDKPRATGQNRTAGVVAEPSYRHGADLAAKVRGTRKER